MNVLRNRVQLIGRLVKSPKACLFVDGKMKVKFLIATNESFKSSDGEKTEINGTKFLLGAHMPKQLNTI